MELEISYRAFSSNLTGLRRKAAGPLLLALYLIRSFKTLPAFLVIAMLTMPLAWASSLPDTPQRTHFINHADGTGGVPDHPSADGEGKNFSLQGLDGASHQLSDWKGKVIMLNFWASWCPSCLAEIKDLIHYQSRFEGKGLQILGLGLDSGHKLRNVQRTFEINYPILLADRKLLETWGNRSGVIPYTVILDRHGHVVYRQSGPMTMDEFNDAVVPLLAQ